MKIGVIGIGNMGKNHVRIYSELKGVEDVYVYDLQNNNNTDMRKNGFIVCETMDELLDYVDAASICVPSKYHLEVAKMAIEKNVHCLIEKPITTTIEEGEQLLNLLKGKNLIVGVGHIERFNPIIEEIIKMELNPVFIEIRRHNPLSSRITDSSVIEDLMIHDIDIIFHGLFNNEIIKDYRLFSGGNNDVCNVLIKFKDFIASISASRMACKKIRTIYIEDKTFTIEGDFITREIFTYWKPEKYGMERERYNQENIIEKIVVNKAEPLKVELKTFIECVKKNIKFPITPEQAVNNLKICEQIKIGFDK